jgi:hypothetical protein
MFPVPAHFLDLGDFSGGFDFRCHFVKTELLGNGVGSTAVVAGKHDDLQPERVEFADRFDHGGFDRIGDGEDASRLAIYRNKHNGLAFLKFPGRGLRANEIGIIVIRLRLAVAKVEHVTVSLTQHRGQILFNSNPP